MSRNGKKDKKRRGDDEDLPDASYSSDNSVPHWFVNFSNQQQAHQKLVVDELKKLNTLPQRVESIERRQDALEIEQQNLGVNLAQLYTWKRQLEGDEGPHKALDREVQNLQARMSAAESAPAPTPDDAFDRPSLPNVIKATAPTRFTKESLNDLVIRMCAEAGLNDPSFKITGPPHSKGFSIAFNGAGNLGKTVASQFMESRKDSAGNWKPTFGKSVAKDDEEPEDVKIFFNPDASPKAERVAMLARKTKALLLAKNPNLTVSIRRADSRIYVDSVPCIQPIANNPDHWDLKFKGTTFSPAQAAEFRNELGTALDATGGEEWF